MEMHHPAHDHEDLNKPLPDLRVVEQPALQAALTRLPKPDIHRHLEGSFTPEMMLLLARDYSIKLPTFDLDELRALVQVTEHDKSLLDFLSKFHVIGGLFVNPEVVEQLTYHSVAEAAADNVVYLELRCSPYYIAKGHNLDVDEVMRAITRGVSRAGKEHDIHVNLILIVERQCGLEPAALVASLAEKYQGDGVVALDLANDEFNYPPGPFAPIFRRARNAGLNITVHAGEAAGPDNIRTAISDLSAQRIGHGVRAFHDPLVETLLRDTGIPLELCVTSNVQTQAVERLSAHPLRRYFDQGIKVTLNTDDPGTSAISLSGEYLICARDFAFNAHEIEILLRNGIDAAFAAPELKRSLQERITLGMNQFAKALAA